MKLGDTPPWSKKRLRKLGVALRSREPEPSDCPAYDDVMLWHHELAAEIAAIVASTDWKADPNVDLEGVHLRVTSRGKTIDTLVQKLQREETLGLDSIQDLAGVRVDADLNLYQQTQLADVMARYFEVPKSCVKDLRDAPHSGYRAVHLWVRCPAGRAEIQIRTEAQSEWANTYERLGDHVGRGIRYGEAASSAAVQTIVEGMHRISKALDRIERQIAMAYATKRVDDLTKVVERIAAGTDYTAKEIESFIAENEENENRIRESHERYLEQLRQVRNMIEGLEEV